MVIKHRRVLIFSYYYDKLEILNQDSSINSSNKERLVKLKETVSSKETRVETILGNKNTKSTLYLDEIANSVPNTMLLDAITYQPLLKPIQKNKLIEQNLNTILIEGESYNSDDFSNWTDTLEGFKWIKAVETQGYGYKTQKSSYFKTQKSSYFTIKLLVDGE